MLYKDYQNSRDAAWEILIKEKVKSLPVKVSDICKHLGIKVKRYIPTDENDGYSTIIDGKPVAFISSLISVPRQRFTCAHELGHIISGDVGKQKLVNREPSPNDNPIEQRANVFASRLLAPLIVLDKLNVQSPEDIVRFCDISITSAKIRFERLQLIRKRNEEFIKTRGYPCFGISPYERKVLRRFRKYIKANKL